MVDKEADVADIAFSESITSFLFSENPPTLPGVDLFALNTQRGRDHGIPGEWEGEGVDEWVSEGGS